MEVAVMKPLLVMIGVFFGYILMYHIYGRFLAKIIFKLDPQAKVPAAELEDDMDFVPTRRDILFGHHFASIAGTGPIVGPAIAVIWGWVPALIWVFLGSIVMGAVHDFGTLVISLRNQGKSISDYTKKYVGPWTGFLFFLIAFFELWVFIAILGLVMAVIFKMYPAAVLPVWSEIPIALVLGYLVYKRKMNVMMLSIIAVIVMYGTIVAGVYCPFTMPMIGDMPPTGTWTIILLAYAFVASILPVTTLLQPRDYINAHELIIAMALLVGGVIFAAFSGQLEFVAPTYQPRPAEAPPMWPFLFITIACGAISGFHSLVSSGTTSKQVASESDALFIGYGGMLMEGALATLVIIAAVAGIGMGYADDGQVYYGVEAWTQHYESWAAASGLGDKVGAFVIGSANMIHKLGIPHAWAIAIMGVFVASFAGTSLDTATRIQRYVVSEIFGRLKVGFFRNIYASTAFAVLTAAALAFASGADGKGALRLWPLFGAINQSLAALALVIITIYLRVRGSRGWLLTVFPAIFMIILTTWATVHNEINFIGKDKDLLSIVNFMIMLIVITVAATGLYRLFKPRVIPAEATDIE
jgi:carbon starvation protein